MAQRMIHYLIGTILADRYNVSDWKRFLLGSIVPDGYRDVKDRDTTHFVNRDDPSVRYYDFEAFREKYRQKMQDPLYLGYYMHLVEDDFYRHLIRVDHDLKVYEDPEGVKKLHRDYEILNSYIIGKWQLRNELSETPDITAETVFQIADFDLPEFLSELSRDFTGDVRGTTAFLTEEILEEFLRKYLPEIDKEFRAVLQDSRYLNARSFGWRRRS